MISADSNSPTSDPGTPVVAKVRTNNFDTLRLIFAFLVIFSHSFPLGSGSYDTEPLWALTRGQTELGKVSVWGFFVISGFLITQSWLRSPSPIKFLGRRIGRIYPAFIVLAMISAIIIVPYASDAHSHTQISLRHFVSHTLRLNVWEMPPVFTKNIHPNVLNGSLWSIPFEFCCYLGVLILGLSRLLQWRYLIVALFVLVVGCHLSMDIVGWTGGGEIFGDLVTWATVLPFFIAGMLFHLFGGQKLLRVRAAIFLLLILVASYFIPHGYVITMPTCGAYVLMQLAYLPALNPLNLGRYGDFSYGVYLYAFPVQQLLVMSAGGHMSPYALFALAAPISLILGALSWFLVERYFVLKRGQVKNRENSPHSNLENLA
jgi:peptidoglycan/LPS O-acetylase OafA/YrhL